MADLLTIPTPMATGAYTRQSEMELKSLNRITNSVTVLTVSLNPEKGKYQDIASAISALPDDGGTIFIKNGIYSIASDITIPDKPVKFVGESRDNAIIKRTGTLTNALFYRSKTSGQTIYDVTFETLTLDANSAATKGIFENSYNANLSGKIVIKQCSFTGFTNGAGSIPIQIEGYKNLVIEESSIDRSQYGISLRTGSNSGKCVIHKCYLTNFGVNAISHTAAGQISIVENTIINTSFLSTLTYEVAIEVTSSSKASVINNDININHGSGGKDRTVIRLPGTGKNVCSNNAITLTATPSAVGYTQAIEAYGSDVVCVGNLIEISSGGNAYVFPLMLYGGSGSTVSGNRVNISIGTTGANFMCHAIWVYTTARTTVTGNVLKYSGSASSYGIVVPTDYCSITGNTIQGYSTPTADTGTGNSWSNNVSS